MGNKQSLGRKKTKEETKQSVATRQEATVATQKKVQETQNMIINEFMNIQTSTDVVQSRNSEMFRLFKITETAKHQLERQDAPLTKTDLIAIVVALKPEMAKELDELEKTTSKDLNVMIRTQIYDPSRYLTSPDSSRQTIPVDNRKPIASLGYQKNNLEVVPT